MNTVTRQLVALRDWVDARFPLMEQWNTHLAKYYAPKNFNFWYFFGSLALVVLVIQILTGIWLTMNYKPAADLAFGSVEYIMRDVPWGWWIRYMHSTGASAFFLVVYLHMFRGLMYGSYKRPRELLWIIGMLIYLSLMGEAFFGYLLPWGQMSYWGAQVIISLFGALPVIGDPLATWIRGDFVVSDVTLNRFFAFHVIALPLLLCGLVVVHLLALHEVGSNNPDGVEIKEHKDANGIPLDGIPFHPYYTVKDIVGVVGFLILFFMVVFWGPDLKGYFLEHNNFIPANPLKTPQEIHPVWYFTPYYAILRAIPHKLTGVISMGCAVCLFFLLPWLDRSPVKSIRYRGWRFRFALCLFTVSFLVLGYLGMQAPTPAFAWMSRFFGIMYFLHFLFLPTYTSPDDHPVAGMYRKVIRLGLWAAIAVFGIALIVQLFQAQPGTRADFIPFALFVVAFTLYGVFVEVTRFYRRDTDKPVPSRVRYP